MPSARSVPCRNPHRRKVLGGAAALAFAIAGCSAPGPDLAADPGAAEQQEAISSVLEQLESMGAEPGEAEGVPSDADDAAPSGQQTPPPITLYLPQEPTGDPAGWQRSPVQCEDRQAAIGSSYVGFAVPGDWELGGKSGGSGSPRSMSFDYGYRSDEVKKVTIAIDSDTRDGDGKLVMYDGHPDSVSTFDYDYQLGDDTVRITFDSVGEIPVGEGTTELFVARPEQAPDRLNDVVYKARIDQIALPQLMFDGSWSTWPSTFVIELSYRPDEGDVPEETVTSIVSSLVMPECSVTNAIVLAELNSQRDVDGDGHIADQQDFMDALQMGG